MSTKNKKTIRDAQVNPNTAKFYYGVKKEKDKEGQRYFLIRLTPEDAEDMSREGWPVEWTQPNPKYPDYEPYPYIKVHIKYDGFKIPSVYMVTNNNRVLLNEETIDQLSGCYFEKVDVTIDNVYLRRFDRNTAYLDIGFFTIEPRELYDEYFGPSHQQSFDDEDDNPFN